MSDFEVQWAVERLQAAIRPDVDACEAPELPKYERHRGPGSTDDVDFFISRDVREVLHCQLNYVVADTQKWTGISRVPAAAERNIRNAA